MLQAWCELLGPIGDKTQHLCLMMLKIEWQETDKECAIMTKGDKAMMAK